MQTERDGGDSRFEEGGSGQFLNTERKPMTSGDISHGAFTSRLVTEIEDEENVFETLLRKPFKKHKPRRGSACPPYIKDSISVKLDEEKANTIRSSSNKSDAYTYGELGTVDVLDKVQERNNSEF